MAYCSVQVFHTGKSLPQIQTRKSTRDGLIYLSIDGETTQEKDFRAWAENSQHFSLDIVSCAGMMSTS